MPPDARKCNKPSVALMRARRSSNGCRKFLLSHVFVVQRDRRDIEALNRHAIGREFLRCAQRRSIERTAPRTASNAEKPHRSAAAHGVRLLFMLRRFAVTERGWRLAGASNIVSALMVALQSSYQNARFNAPSF
jgi:hypothetical protein